VPTRQQLIITEPADGAHADLPMVRIMDAALYARPCQGGFLGAVYEEAPLEPVIIVLSHLFFGEGVGAIGMPGLRGVFAAYPGEKPKAPALAPACAQHLTLTQSSLGGGFAGQLAALF
jgi:hypothetical protein